VWRVLYGRMLERVVIGGGRALLLDGRDMRVHCIAMLGEWHGDGRKCGNNVGYMQECPRAI
jgi:hypothetical protein